MEDRELLKMLRKVKSIPVKVYGENGETVCFEVQVGVKPGVPDMFLPVAREGCHGLYIELKRRDGGRVSPEQTAWMDALARQGYKTALCHGWDAAREEIQRYLGGKWA